MKRIVAIVAAAAICLSLSACGQQDTMLKQPSIIDRIVSVFK